MPERSPRLTATEVAGVLRRNGFELVSQKGSHQKWRNGDTGRQVIVPVHKGKQLPIGTLRSIIDGSGLDSEVFKM